MSVTLVDFKLGVVFVSIVAGKGMVLCSAMLKILRAM